MRRFSGSYHCARVATRSFVETKQTDEGEREREREREIAGTRATGGKHAVSRRR